jgi:hypothetical protein
MSKLVTCTGCSGIMSPDEDEYWCATCDIFYHLCSRCWKQGKVSLDDVEYSKGQECTGCEQHFCQHCWQTSGTLGPLSEDGEKEEDEGTNWMSDDLYLCADCLEMEKRKD